MSANGVGLAYEIRTKQTPKYKAQKQPRSCRCRSPVSLQQRPAKMREWLKRMPLGGSSRAVSPFCRSALHPAGETTARAVQSAEFGCRSRKFDRAATLHSGSGSGVGEA